MPVQQAGLRVWGSGRGVVTSLGKSHVLVAVEENVSNSSQFQLSVVQDFPCQHCDPTLRSITFRHSFDAALSSLLVASFHT